MARRHFGIAPSFGGARFAQAKFGDEVVHIKYSQFGSIAFGDEVFGDVLVLGGIYRRVRNPWIDKMWRSDYYTPRNPRSEAQQIRRAKFASGVASWQGLTLEQKNIYNERANWKHAGGYSLFLREYMRS